MNKHKILYKLIAMFTIVILLNAININTTKAITMNAYPMTDSNFNIWGDSVQTTFSDKGYFSVLNVNGTEANIKNCSGSLNGVSVQTKLSYISNGNYVKISFEATNTSGSAKTIGIATYNENDKEANIICAKSADQLLAIGNITASFVLGNDGEKITISGRSIGDINVQVILEKMGGGGHITLAGAQVEGKSMDEVKEELKERIGEYFEENEN